MKNINYLTSLCAFEVQSLDRQTREWLSFVVNLFFAQKDSKGTRIKKLQLGFTSVNLINLDQPSSRKKQPKSNTNSKST